MSNELDGMPEFAAGALLCGGRFVVVRSLGHGGLGRAYVARDEELGRNVACKIAHEADDLAWRESRQQFEKLIRIQSRDVVRPLGFFVHEDHLGRRPVLVLEAIEGRDFKDWAPTVSIHERYKGIARVAAAIAELHNVGLAHGDFRAGLNIRVSDDDRIVLIDPDSEISGDAPMPGDRASLAGLIQQWLPDFAKKELAPILRMLTASENEYSMSAIAAQLRSAAATVPLIDLSTPLLSAAADAYREEVESHDKQYQHIRQQRSLSIECLAYKLEAIAAKVGLQAKFIGAADEREEHARDRDRGYFVQRLIEVRAGTVGVWRLHFDGAEDFYKPTPYIGSRKLITVGTSSLQRYRMHGDRYDLEIRLDDDDVSHIWASPDRPAPGPRRRLPPFPEERDWAPLDDRWILERLGELIGRPVQPP
jgi:hypothetical protein